MPEELQEAQIRQAKPSDLTAILAIVADAKQFLAKQGLDQWQKGYPAETDITRDIDKMRGFVLEISHQIAGYAAIICGEDAAYRQIEKGQWSNNSRNYVVVHRMALSSDFRGRGLAGLFWKLIFTRQKALGYRDFRVDTHEENLPMRASLERVGFISRGIVHYEGPRIAYQKELEK